MHASYKIYFQMTGWWIWNDVEGSGRVLFQSAIPMRVIYCHHGLGLLQPNSGFMCLVRPSLLQFIISKFVTLVHEFNLKGCYIFVVTTRYLLGFELALNLDIIWLSSRFSAVSDSCTVSCLQALNCKTKQKVQMCIAKPVLYLSLASLK